jgi:transmembrane sensor
VKKVSELAGRTGLGVKKHTGPSNIFVQAGGVLLGMLALGTLIYFWWNEQNVSPPVSITTTDATQKIILPDSSRLTLNRHSEVTFPATYKKNVREVYIKGEGFFKVVHNQEKPFIVHTSVADVRVVGTSFNISADKGHVEVGVAEGKVLVMTPTDSGYVRAGESAVKYEQTALKINTAANENEWGYATQKFTFKNTALHEVLATIQKSTSYSFEIESRMIENCQLTATFENISADEMVNLIAESLDLSVTKNGSVFTLQGEGCQP